MDIWEVVGLNELFSNQKRKKTANPSSKRFFLRQYKLCQVQRV